MSYVEPLVPPPLLGFVGFLMMKTGPEAMPVVGAIEAVLTTTY